MTIVPQDYATGDGTVENPWANDCIKKAYDACPVGGTVFLKAGYYELTGRCYIEKLVNIIGEGIDKTIIITDSDANGIQIDDVDYCTIKNLTIDGDAQIDDTPYLATIEIDYADWCVIENVEVKNAGYYGISLDHCNHTVLRNVYTHGAAHHGVSACSDDSPANMYNTYDGVYCWDNTYNGFKDRGISDDTDYPEDAYNYFNNIQAWDNVKNGIMIAAQKGGVVSNCSSRNNGEAGFELGVLEDFNFHNCIALNNDEEGIILSGGSKYVNFTDMIVKNNNTSDGAEITGILVDDSTNIRFVNCHSYDSRTITAIDIAFVDGGGGEDTITMGDALFLDAGFVAGEVITVTGSTSNNDDYTIVSVIAGTINVATGELTAEEAGDTVTILQTKVQTLRLEADGTSDSIELINCDFSGNLTANILNSASATITSASIESEHFRIGDGLWTNYVQITAAGALTTVGTASITSDVTGDLTGNADTVTFADNDATDEANEILFAGNAAESGDCVVEADSDFTYNPSTGTLAVTVLDLTTELADAEVSNTLTSSTCTGNAATATALATTRAIGGVNFDGTAAITPRDSTHDHALGSDEDYSGILDSAPVGETVAIGDLLYYDWTAVEWKKAKADAVGTTPAMRIALATGNDGDTVLMLVQGYIRDDDAFNFGAARVYLNDDTAGTCDDTAPAESGDQIQLVGIGITADILYFCPSIDVGEI